MIFTPNVESVRTVAVARNERFMNLGTLFRFTGQIPTGKFEFTCSCGAWNSTQLEESLVRQGASKDFECKGCKKAYHVWQQATHWHLSMGKSTE